MNSEKLKDKIELNIIVKFLDLIDILYPILDRVSNKYLEVKKHIRKIIPEYIELACLQNNIENNDLRLIKIAEMQGKLDTIKILIEVLNNELEIQTKDYLKIGKRIVVLDKMQNSLKKYIKSNIKRNRNGE